MRRLERGRDTGVPPRTGTDVDIRQAVRVPRDLSFNLSIGERAELVCSGVMASGMLRHPMLRADRKSTPGGQVEPP